MRKLNRLAAVALGIAAAGATCLSAEARGPYGGVQVQSVVQSNFATRQAQLRSQIHAAVAAGTLNPSIASRLLAELDQINAETQSYVFQGGISNMEANRIVAMFADVTDQLDASVRTMAGVVSPYSFPYPYRMTPAYGRLHQRRVDARLFPYGWLR